MVYFYIIPCIVSIITYAIFSYLVLKPKKIEDLLHPFCFIPFINIIVCIIMIIILVCGLLSRLGEIDLK